MSRRDELASLVDDPVPFLGHPEAAMRRLAVSALGPRALELVGPLGDMLCGDPDPLVRAEAAEMIASAGIAAVPALDAARDDDDERVVEAVATAYGEVTAGSAVDWLVEQARHAASRQVQEAAVAALGAIGDRNGLPALLELVAAGPPQVRRRAVVALTVFDGDDVEAAIRAAAADRNPMVREAAQMVVGRAAPEPE